MSQVRILVVYKYNRITADTSQQYKWYLQTQVGFLVIYLFIYLRWYHVALYKNYHKHNTLYNN